MIQDFKLYRKWKGGTWYQIMLPFLQMILWMRYIPKHNNRVYILKTEVF